MDKSVDEGTRGVGASMGPATDKHNEPVIDPTANVLQLVQAANLRQDDLRAAERRYNDLRDSHQREIAQLRADHSNRAIAALATQTSELATTLEARRSSDIAGMNARVSALELAFSANVGKQGVIDPAMDALVKQVAALVALQAAQGGKSQGMSTAWVGLLGALGAVGTALGIYAALKP